MELHEARTYAQTLELREKIYKYWHWGLRFWAQIGRGLLHVLCEILRAPSHRRTIEPGRTEEVRPEWHIF